MLEFFDKYWLVLIPTCWVVAISVNRFIEWYKESRLDNEEAEKTENAKKSETGG